ncbi:MAG TPA: hypothetical protein VF045_01210 [Acidimicrobiales bacterium]
MRRYLLVANQTLGGQPLLEKVRALMAEGPCQFHLIVPATHPHDHLTWTEGEATAIARHRLEEALHELRSLGAEVDGEVGDERPVDAVGDAIRARPGYDAILISTLPRGVSRWLGQDLPHRLGRAFSLPVIHVTGTPVAPG